MTLQQKIFLKNEAKGNIKTKKDLGNTAHNGNGHSESTKDENEMEQTLGESYGNTGAFTVSTLLLFLYI